MRSHTLGFSQTPVLIVLIVLFVGACGLAWMQAQEAHRAREETRKARAEVLNLEDRFRAKVVENDRICRTAGYHGEEDAGARERSEEVILRHLDRVRTRTGTPAFPGARTCKGMIDELARRMVHRDRRIAELEVTLEVKDQRIRSARTERVRLLGEKEEYIRSLRDRIDALQAQKDRAVSSSPP